MCNQQVCKKKTLNAAERMPLQSSQVYRKSTIIIYHYYYCILFHKLLGAISVSSYATVTEFYDYVVIADYPVL